MTILKEERFKHMKEIKVFENEEFGAVRAVEIDGKPFFVATDIAKALGYSNPRDAVLRHCKGVVKHDGVSKMDIPDNKARAEKPQKWMGGVAA